MEETLAEVIAKSNDLFFAKISKPIRHDSSTWNISITDSRSRLNGKTVKLSSLDYKYSAIRRENHFFHSYRINFPDGSFEYLVDTKKANHRKTIQGFVNSAKEYALMTNDISLMKNEKSFRVSYSEMKRLGIDNFVELCYYFREFSAVGIGIVRTYRNMIVLDIDVDCSQEDNRKELERILYIFGKCGAMPDFEIHNNNNGHVQLQWLMQSLQVKNVSETAVKKLIDELYNDPNKNREISIHMHYNFAEDNENCGEYILYTRALTYISPKEKFGDRNFTFWKAKNFFTALLGLYGLELRMPYYMNGRIEYLSKESMNALFSTKQARKEYYDEAPTFQEIKDRTKSIMEQYVEIEKPNLSTIKKYADEKLKENYICKSQENGEESRNSFVLSYTRKVAWDVMRKMMIKSSEEIMKMPQKDVRKLESKIKALVKKEFKRKDEEYRGHWPGTSNNSSYTGKEFDSTFRTALDFAESRYNGSGIFSDENRGTSLNERRLKMDMKLIVVDYLRNKYKLKRDTLMNTANDILRESGKKEMSLASLKRYISKSKSMGIEEREELYRHYFSNVDEREDNLLNANSNSEKCTDIAKKKLESISINIVEDIRKSFNI